MCQEILINVCYVLRDMQSSYFHVSLDDKHPQVQQDIHMKLTMPFREYASTAAGIASQRDKVKLLEKLLVGLMLCLDCVLQTPWMV